MNSRGDALLDLKDIVRILRKEVKRAGSQAAWARETGVNQPDLSSTITGKRPPTKDILRALNLRKVFAYQREDEHGAKQRSRVKPKRMERRLSRG
jgi:hypothetical protein